MEKGILPTPKVDETEGFKCLGHSNWTICIPLSPFCPGNFPTFFTFILEGQFLLPQMTKNERKGIIPTSKLDDTGGFKCLGHSNWTICIPLDPFCSENFPSFSLSYWEANSYYPRGTIMGKWSSPNPKSG